MIAELERRLQQGAGEDARVADYFHMFAGTSTGGLVALSLTTPDPDRPGRPRVSGARLPSLYTEDGPKIFRRSLLRKVLTARGWIAPKYDLGPLKAAVEKHLGSGRVEDALRDLVVTSYDMTNREPYFFKRWRARESPESERNAPLSDAALATSAAPTYFPSHDVDGRALVDGGVFAANPVIAAIIEALKRRSDDPYDLVPDDLMVVSIGTGLREVGFKQRQVAGWGKLGWMYPRGGEPPVLAAVLGGGSDGADHWAHTLLNHPGDARIRPQEVGRGPRYFRLQVALDPIIAMDDASTTTLERRLPAAAKELIDSHERELTEIVERLLRFEPLPPDPPPAT